MGQAEVLPIPDRPALELVRADGSRTLVVADLHLGLGSSDGPARLPPESLARTMAWDLVALARERGATDLLIVGDVKHSIVGTPPWLRSVVFDFFSTLLTAGLTTSVVVGNHDVGLARWLPKEVAVHPARGLLLDNVGFFHGHRWPANPLLRARRLVVGHLHPGFRFAPTAESPSAKERCWVRTTFPPPAPPDRRRRRHAPLRSEELIVLPAFNPIAGTESLNREKPRRGRTFLVKRFLARGASRAYLLDGTDLGEIFRSLRSVPRPRAAPAGAAGRSRARGTGSRSRRARGAVRPRRTTGTPRGR